jgi:uncharacterized protein (TIGR03000 family)
LFNHGSSGGGSHGSLFSHGSSGGNSHGGLFAGHGSSGGGSHGGLFSHGSSGGNSHGGLFAGHGSSGGGGSHGSLFNHGSSGGGSHGSLFNHGSSGGGSHGGLFNHGSSGGGSHGGLFNHGSHGGGSSGGYAYSASVTPQAQTASYVAPAASSVAYLNISVPEDAKVYLQDQLMAVTGTQRRFVTPMIEAGTQHVYTVKVEVVRNGQTYTKTTEAVVAPGQEVAVAVGFEGQNQELVAAVGALASL